jgi:hypothetical protein
VKKHVTVLSAEYDQLFNLRQFQLVSSLGSHSQMKRRVSLLVRVHLVVFEDEIGAELRDELIDEDKVP